MKIISLKIVAERLNYKKFRSAVRWCKNNQLLIFKFNGSNRRYVLAEQFEWICWGRYLKEMKTITKYFETTPSSRTDEKFDQNTDKLHHEKYYQTRLNKFISEL